MKKIFVAASAAFAAIPGVAVIASGLGTPPGSGYRWLFGGVIEAFGALALLILWINRSKLRRISKRRITRAAIILCGVCFIFIGGGPRLVLTGETVLNRRDYGLGWNGLLRRVADDVAVTLEIQAAPETRSAGE